MGVEFWIPVLSALVGGGGLIGSLILLPKLKAEARKINTESDGLIVARLYAEIDRLDLELKVVRDKFTALEKASTAEKRTLERENKQLRNKVGKLEDRVRGLEAVLKIAPQITTEMQARLDELKAVPWPPSDEGNGK